MAQLKTSLVECNGDDDDDDDMMIRAVLDSMHMNKVLSKRLLSQNRLHCGTDSGKF